MELCEYCAKPCTTRCSKCSLAYWCDRNCQKRDWKRHKSWCSPLTATSDEPACTVNSVAPALSSPSSSPIPLPDSSPQASLTSSLLPPWRAALAGSFTISPSSSDIPFSSNTEIPPLASVVVSWLDESTGASGTASITFLDGGSLAAELYASAVGQADGFRSLFGGWLYLLSRHPSIFWSALSHRRSPPGLLLPPSASPGRPWLDVWCLAELERAAKEREDAADAEEELRVAREEAGEADDEDAVQQARTPFSTESLAASLGPNFCVHVLLGGVKPQAVLPHSAASRPAWWRDMESVWSSALRRAEKEGRPQCLFFGGEEGCAMGGACEAWHDARWRIDSQRIKREGEEGEDDDGVEA